MEEVATGKVTGEEEYWSHTDLWDFAANVKGARVAFEDVKPILGEARPGAGDGRSSQRFAAIDAAARRSIATATATSSTPSSSRAEVKQLADAVNAVSEPLSHLTAAVLP